MIIAHGGLKVIGQGQRLELEYEGRNGQIYNLKATLGSFGYDIWLTLICFPVIDKFSILLIRKIDDIVVT